MIEKFSHNLYNIRGNPKVNKSLQQFLVVFESFRVQKHHLGGPDTHLLKVFCFLFKEITLLNVQFYSL